MLHFNPSQNTHTHKFILPWGQILIPLLNNTESDLSKVLAEQVAFLYDGTRRLLLNLTVSSSNLLM